MTHQSQDFEKNGSYATIDHQTVTMSISPRRPDSYSKATSRDMIRDQKYQVTAASSQNDDIGKKNARVVTAQPSQIVAQKIDESQKPKDYVVTSCAVILFCNFVFGILAYYYGVNANYAWQLGDLDTSRRKAKIALIFVIVGVIVGILTYVLVISLVVCCSPFKKS